MRSRSILKSLMHLYFFTWSECLSFVIRMKAAITRHEIQDARLNEMIAQMEQEALDYPKINATEPQKATPVRPQIQQLSKLLTLLRRRLNEIVEISSEGDEAHRLALSYHQTFFYKPRRGMLPIHEILGLTRSILEVIKPEMSAQLGFATLYMRIQESYATLNTLYIESSILKENTGPSIGAISLEANAQMQDRLRQIIAYVIATYWDRPEYGPLFKEFEQIVDALNALASARHQRSRRPVKQSASSEAV